MSKASVSDVSSRDDLGPISSDSPRTWLNIVIDLNGILCTCVPAWAAKGSRSHDLGVHSPTVPIEVGKKLVWVRPGCSDFLSRLSAFATLTVWSSMMTSTTKDICDYLFSPINPIKPLRVLGQEDCDRVPLRKSGGRTFYMKEHGTQKDIFLKTLSDHLFNSYDGLYTEANTLVIDDSPIKHMLNLPANVLLLSSWSHTVDGAAEDSVLLNVLLPYLLGLHEFRGSLKKYRSAHLLGRPMFYDNLATCRQYVNIRDALSDWKNLSRPSMSGSF